MNRGHVLSVTRKFATDLENGPIQLTKVIADALVKKIPLLSDFMNGLEFGASIYEVLLCNDPSEMVFRDEEICRVFVAEGDHSFYPDKVEKYRNNETGDFSVTSFITLESTLVVIEMYPNDEGISMIKIIKVSDYVKKAKSKADEIATWILGSDYIMPCDDNDGYC